MSTIPTLDLGNTVAKTGFSALPAGWYKVKITGSVVDALKSGNGSLLKLTLEVIEGEQAGESMWHRFNLWHPKVDTQDSALSFFKGFLQACGMSDEKLTAVNPETDLVGLTTYADVKVKVATDGNTTNEIKNFKPELPVTVDAQQFSDVEKAF